MAEQATAAPAAGDSKRKRTRSPEHPFINLETALRRAKQFYDIETRNAASLVVAAKHWGYEPKSSGGLQTAATLVSFGLLRDEGTGDKRKLQLSQLALRILLDQRPDSEERAQLIRQVALTPKIHKHLWSKWGASLPSEAQMRHTLIVEWEPPFNEKSVDGFIREYKETVAFARLTESDEVSDTYVPKVGDFVQWESSGVLQLQEPMRIREISPDGKFALIEGSNTGIPISELIKEQAPAGVIVTPAMGNQSIPAVPEPRFQPVVPGHRMQEEVFSVKEGKIILHWPSPLSAESVEDLKAWLTIIQRKFERSVAPKDENRTTQA